MQQWFFQWLYTKLEKPAIPSTSKYYKTTSDTDHIKHLFCFFCGYSSAVETLIHSSLCKHRMVQRGTWAVDLWQTLPIVFLLLSWELQYDTAGYYGLLQCKRHYLKKKKKCRTLWPLEFKKVLWAHVVMTGLATVPLHAADTCWVQLFVDASHGALWKRAYNMNLMDYCQLSKKIHPPLLCLPHLWNKETFISLVIPQAPLFFPCAPAGNGLATDPLTDGISISSQAERWLYLQPALLQCQQRTEMVPHTHREREKNAGLPPPLKMKGQREGEFVGQTWWHVIFHHSYRHDTEKWSKTDHHTIYKALTVEAFSPLLPQAGVYFLLGVTWQALTDTSSWMPLAQLSLFEVVFEARF